MSEEQQQQDAVTAAAAVLGELELKHAKLVEAWRELVQRRQEISFDAHTGVVAKKKDLDTIISQITTHDQQVLSVEAAIAEAQARVVAARLKEEREQEKASARELKKLIGDMLEHGAVVDDCLADLVNAGNNLKECFDRLSQLRISSPRFEQLEVMGHLAILTALNASIWKRGFETLAPNQRKNFTDVIAAWRTMLMAGVEARLGEQKEEAA
jgi:hypothetical protein